jgi:hypothetical protein
MSAENTTQVVADEDLNAEKKYGSGKVGREVGAAQVHGSARERYTSCGLVLLGIPRWSGSDGDLNRCLVVR